MSFLLGGLAALALFSLAGDAVKQTWTPSDLPVESSAKTARTIARGVVPALNDKENQTGQSSRISGNFAVPTTIAPERADQTVLDRPKLLEKDQASSGVQDKGLPRLRFELEDLKDKTPQRSDRPEPVREKKAPTTGGITYLGEIVFNGGKVKLTKKAEAKVKDMAAGIKAARDVVAVVEGHADIFRLSPKNRRKYGGNYGLSLVRAAAVARALVAAGVEPGRVYIIAHGATPAPASKGSERMVRVGVRANLP